MPFVAVIDVTLGQRMNPIGLGDAEKAGGGVSGHQVGMGVVAWSSMPSCVVMEVTLGLKLDLHSRSVAGEAEGGSVGWRRALLFRCVGFLMPFVAVIDVTLRLNEDQPSLGDAGDAGGGVSWHRVARGVAT
jgi:hypothetical protein